LLGNSSQQWRFFTFYSHALFRWLILLTTELIAPTVLVITSRHGSHRKYPFSKNNYSCVRIRCRGNIYTEFLPRNGLCLQRNRLATGLYATVFRNKQGFSTCFMLVSCLASSLNLKMEPKCSTEASVEFSTVLPRVISQTIGLLKYRCENLKSYKNGKLLHGARVSKLGCANYLHMSGTFRMWRFKKSLQWLSLRDGPNWIGASWNFPPEDGEISSSRNVVFFQNIRRWTKPRSPVIQSAVHNRQKSSAPPSSSKEVYL
jgi:hypothetical protein